MEAEGVTSAFSQTERNRLFREKAFPFVRTGTVYGFELHEELVEPTILPSESAISALLSMQSGNIFGLTSGKRGHLFYFNPLYGVVDVGLISETPVAGGALVETQTDQIIGGWWAENGGGGLFWHDAVFEKGVGLEDFKGAKYPIECLALPDQNDGISALVYHKASQKVFGITRPGNKIISFDVKSRRVEMVAQVDSIVSSVLVFLPEGKLLGSCEEGQLWQYQLGEARLEMLKDYVPCQMGKRYASGVGSLLVSSSGLVYGGTTTDGFFFSYDTVKRKVINLGKPNRQSNIRALTEGYDGLIYGVVEEPHGLAHLFYFAPGNREFVDLGVLTACIPIYWTAHSLGSICTGIHGEIFLGETDTISHLFVYYPPVVRRER